MRPFHILLGLLLSLLMACRPAGEATEPAASQAPTTTSAEHAGHAPASPKATPQKAMSAKEMAEMSVPSKPVPPKAVPPKAAATIAGRSAVMISAEKQQLIGLQTVLVDRRVLRATIRAVGRVDYDEQAISHVHTKVEGWIEKLHAGFTGQWVRKGQPLLEIYSPDLFTAQKEYLLALQTRRLMAKSASIAGIDIVDDTGSDLVAAARQKLLLWDFQPAQIRALEQTGRVRKTVTLFAPASGFVTEKKALSGMQVMPGMDLYTLVDLSRVWVHAQIYEYELPRVRLGQLASMRLSYEPGAILYSHVSYIYPTLDPRTRTATIRMVFANPGGRLKPEMHTEVTLETGSGRKELAIPADAVIDSGTRKLVFLTRGDGYFEPREIVTGGRVGDYYPVLKGLKDQDRVVSAANFLVDSESQLKAASGAMGGHGH